jgi:hypothetical protein
MAREPIRQVPHYAYYTSARRENWQPEGFDFDVNMFENLIDCWTPMEDFPIILQCDNATLDNFCLVVYGKRFKDTYNFLLRVTNAMQRKAFKMMSNQGNAFSQSLVSKHFMGLKDEQDSNQNVRITIVNDLQEDDSKED